MSFLGAGEPSPAPGTAAGYAFYLGVFTHIFAQHNALAAAALVKDANSGIGGLTYIGLAPTGSFTGVAVAAASGYTGTPFAYSKTGQAAVATVNTDASMTALAFHGPADSAAALTTAGTNNQVLVNTGSAWVAGAVTGATVAQGTITPDKLGAQWYTAAATAMKVHVAPGTVWPGGSPIAFPGGDSPAIAVAGIASGQARIDLLYIDGSGALNWQQGAPGPAASAPPPANPAAAFVPVVYVKTYFGAAAITGYADLGHDAFFSLDVRLPTNPPTAITNARLAAAAVQRNVVADGQAAAQTTPDKTVQLLGGYTYYNTARVAKTVSGASPAVDAVNALPTGSNLRYDLLYADDTGALAWKAGAPSPSASYPGSIPIPDQNTHPICNVGPLAVGTTAITTAMIFDARSSPTAGNAVASAVGSAVDLTGVPFVTVGANGSTTAETSIVPLLAGTASGTVNGQDLSLVTGALGIATGTIGSGADASLASTLLDHRTEALANLAQNAFVFAGATVQLAAASGLTINGHWKYNPSASNVVTLSGASGLRDFWADSTDNGSVGGNGFKIVATSRGTALTTTRSAAPSGNATYLATAIYKSSGTLASSQFPDFGSLAKVAPSQITLKPIVQRTAGGAGGQLISSTTLAVLTGSGVNVDIAEPMSFICFGSVMAFNNSVALTAQAYIAYSGPDAGVDAYTPAVSNTQLINGVPGSTYLPAGIGQMGIVIPPDYITLNPGRYAFGLVANASTGNFVAYSSVLFLIPTA